MSSDILLAIAKLLLPEVLVTYFDLTKHQIKGEERHFYVTEYIKTPDGYSGEKRHSKGFFAEATVNISLFVRRMFFYTSPCVDGLRQKQSM